jgi:choline monooxygenase
MSKFTIDSDIRKAKTIPSEFYRSQELFEASREKLFLNSWQFIGNKDLVRSPGQVYPFVLLAGYLDEPLVLTKDKTGSVHLLSNVCTHRGNLVALKPCQAANLRCNYHGRIFQLDGRFQSMPEFKEVQEFPSELDNLRSFPLHHWGNWLFTSLGNAFPAEVFLQEMQDRLGWLPFSDFVFHPDLSRDFVVRAHWALYCENYLEGFHIPFVHAGLNAVIDFGNYTTELFRYSNLQIGIAKEEEDCFLLPPDSPDFGKKVAAYYFFVFPNMMFNFYPWGLSVNIVNPIGLEETRVSFLTYLWDPAKYDSGAGAGLDGVEQEDEEVVEQVQKGIKSRFYRFGRYSVTREQGTHHFHCLLASMLD